MEKNTTLCKICIQITGLTRFAYEAEIPDHKLKVHILEKRDEMGQESRKYVDSVMRGYFRMKEKIASGFSEMEICELNGFCGAPVVIDNFCGKCIESLDRLKKEMFTGNFSETLLGIFKEWPVFEQVYFGYGYHGIADMLKSPAGLRAACNSMDLC